MARSSERSFGLVFATFFGFVALWPLVSGRPLRMWALGVALVFLAAAFIAPRLLAPLNRLWHRLGLFLHHIVNPVVMALVYYGSVVPLGLILKARNKDLLRLRRDPEAQTYWITRDPPGSMSNQF